MCSDIQYILTHILPHEPGAYVQLCICPYSAAGGRIRTATWGHCGFVRTATRGHCGVIMVSLPGHRGFSPFRSHRGFRRPLRRGRHFRRLNRPLLRIVRRRVPLLFGPILHGDDRFPAVHPRFPARMMTRTVHPGFLRVSGDVRRVVGSPAVPLPFRHAHAYHIYHIYHTRGGMGKRAGDFSIFDKRRKNIYSICQIMRVHTPSAGAASAPGAAGRTACGRHGVPVRLRCRGNAGTASAWRVRDVVSVRLRCRGNAGAVSARRVWDAVSVRLRCRCGCDAAGMRDATRG